MRDNIPDNAIRVQYNYGHLKGRFYIWQTSVGQWQWSALGNNGQERRQEDAIRSAHDWIVNNTVTKREN